MRGSLGRAAPELADGIDTPASDDLGAWIQCYAKLTAALALADERMARRDGDLRATVTAALDERPERVRLTVPEKDGRAWMVYPKSFHALQFLETLDVALREVRLTVAALDATPPGDLEKETEAAALEPMLRSHAVRLWAWILTSEGCGLPFDDNRADVEPPEWTKLLAPADLVAILAGHIEVNRTRLAIVAAAFPPESDTISRLSVGGFMGSVAQELGRPARELMRSWSVGAVFAQVVTAAQAQKESFAAAKGRTT